MLTKIKSKFVYLPLDNIDTDQIIPSDYLKTTVKSNLLIGLFDELKNDLSESLREQLFDQNINILISGENFGCGSSREHAVWALQEAGYKAIIAPSFADIFKSNSMKNGLLPIVLSKETINSIIHNENGELKIDIDLQEVHFGEEHVNFEISSFHKFLLLNKMTEFDYLHEHKKNISEYERTLDV